MDLLEIHFGWNQFHKIGLNVKPFSSAMEFHPSVSEMGSVSEARVPERWCTCTALALHRTSTCCTPVGKRLLWSDCGTRRLTSQRTDRCRSSRIEARGSPLRTFDCTAVVEAGVAGSPEVLQMGPDTLDHRLVQWERHSQNTTLRQRPCDWNFDQSECHFEASSMWHFSHLTALKWAVPGRSLLLEIDPRSCTCDSLWKKSWAVCLLVFPTIILIVKNICELYFCVKNWRINIFWWNKIVFRVLYLFLDNLADKSKHQLTIGNTILFNSFSALTRWTIAIREKWGKCSVAISRCLIRCHRPELALFVEHAKVVQMPFAKACCLSNCNFVN